MGLSSPPKLPERLENIYESNSIAKYTIPKIINAKPSCLFCLYPLFFIYLIPEYIPNEENERSSKKRKVNGIKASKPTPDFNPKRNRIVLEAITAHTVIRESIKIKYPILFELTFLFNMSISFDSN